MLPRRVTAEQTWSTRSGRKALPLGGNALQLAHIITTAISCHVQPNSTTYQPTVTVTLASPSSVLISAGEMPMQVAWNPGRFESFENTAGDGEGARVEYTCLHYASIFAILEKRSKVVQGARLSLSAYRTASFVVWACDLLSYPCNRKLFY